MSDIQTTIRFLSTSEGGLKLVASSCKPQLKFHHLDIGQNSVMLTFDDTIENGEELSADVSFLSPEIYEGLLNVDDTFTMLTGSRIIGHGTITKIHHEKFVQKINIDDVATIAKTLQTVKMHLYESTITSLLTHDVRKQIFNEELLPKIQRCEKILLKFNDILDKKNHRTGNNQSN